MYVSEPLSPDIRLDTFDSGEPALDQWLREHAASAEARRTSRTFVWRDGDRVVAYYSLAAHLVVAEELPRRLAHGQPRQLPAVLLARLALDRSLHGRGLGGALLADALGRVVDATDNVAARLVVVDALHERAADFYAHHGFTRIPDRLRLVQKMSDVAAALRG